MYLTDTVGTKARFSFFAAVQLGVLHKAYDPGVRAHQDSFETIVNGFNGWTDAPGSGCSSDNHCICRALARASNRTQNNFDACVCCRKHEHGTDTPHHLIDSLPSLLNPQNSLVKLPQYSLALKRRDRPRTELRSGLDVTN